MKISTNELLDALTLAAGPRMADPDSTYTTAELRRLTRWSLRHILEVLHELKADGRIEVQKVQREAIDGRVQFVSAYRFVRKQKRP